MAPKKSATKREQEAEKNVKTLIAEVQAQNKERMDSIEAMIDKLVEVVEKQVSAKPDAPISKEEAAIVSAGPNKYTTNPEWESAAKEVLGDYLDHTEVEHEKTGGIKFTVVIKSEKSNAPQDYLQRTKSDRRTKEVGAAGMDGVIEWCKLIRSNLKRTEKN